MKHYILTILLPLSLWSMSAVEVQNAPKEELMCIKNLGEKRVSAILDYRQKNPIDSLEELKEIRGIGQSIVSNIKEDRLKRSCMSTPKSTKNSTKKKKKDIKAE